MATYRTTLFFRRAKKALKVLREKGPQEFYNRVKDFIRRRGQIEVLTRHTAPLEYDRVPVHFAGKKLDHDMLLHSLERLKSLPFSLALSQDDYVHVVGGVQLKLADQQREMNLHGQAYLHLSPYLVRNTLDFSDQPGVMRLTLDGQFLGYVDDETLLSVLATLIGHGTLRSIELHHLMGWKPGYIAHILDMAGKSPIHLWLHDFFSICPNYVLLRNDREYCHAPDPQSNACKVCYYGSIRPLHYQAIENLIQRYPIQAVAPSEFALELWRQKFPVFNGEGLVIPNATLVWDDKFTSTDKDKALRVAFVGYPVMHKGWQTWLNLTEKFGQDPRYEFFHFSADWQRSPNFEKVSVIVNPQNRSAMTDALHDNEIDVAFLWSICPETFSFTLYESLAAGCYVVTNPASGNIQSTIIKNPQIGVVYLNETELVQAFEEGSIIQNFVDFNENHRRTAMMTINVDTMEDQEKIIDSPVVL